LNKKNKINLNENEPLVEKKKTKNIEANKIKKGR